MDCEEQGQGLLVPHLPQCPVSPKLPSSLPLTGDKFNVCPGVSGLPLRMNIAMCLEA